MKVVNQFGERTDFSLQRGNGVRGKLAYAILNGLSSPRNTANGVRSS